MFDVCATPDVGIAHSWEQEDRYAGEMHSPERKALLIALSSTKHPQPLEKNYQFPAVPGRFPLRVLVQHYVHQNRIHQNRLQSAA